MKGRPKDESRVPHPGKRFLSSDGFNFHFVFIANMTVIRFQNKVIAEDSFLCFESIVILSEN